MAPLLQVKDLIVHFETDRGLVEAIDSANLTINRGQVIALVGESGCGKTTMARSILNVIPSPPGRIVQGSVVFNGSDILTLSEKVCNATIRGRSISLIPQDPYSSFNPLFTIGTQIKDIVFRTWRKRRVYANGSSGVEKNANERILEILTRVHLPSPESVLRKHPHELSGGQRQRIMIAMALLPHPQLVIADEPTTALDVTIQAQIISLLRHLVVEQDVSVLYITHDLAVASKISDQIVVMYAGQEMESAPTGTFFVSPSHPYTQKLLECLPNPKGLIRDIPGTVPSLIKPPAGCRFYPRCDRALEQCRQEKPPRTQISPMHWVRCYRPVL